MRSPIMNDSSYPLLDEGQTVSEECSAGSSANPAAWHGETMQVSSVVNVSERKNVGRYSVMSEIRERMEVNAFLPLGLGTGCMDRYSDGSHCGACDRLGVLA